MAQISQKELFRQFLEENLIEGVAGNGRVKNNQYIHYFTPICERYKNKIVFNHTRYSLATGQLQKMMKQVIPQDIIIDVGGVPEGYKGSLTDFIKVGNKV